MAAGAFVYVPIYVEAATSNGSAFVSIAHLPTTLTTISVFKATIPTGVGANLPVTFRASTPTAAQAAPAVSAAASAVVSRELSSLLRQSSEAIQPAVFSISGEPGQTFSISVPQAGTLSSGLGSVEVSGFAHSGGNTPSIGTNGSFTFAVGANLKLIGPQVSATSGGGSQETTSSVAGSVSARKRAAPQDTPFGMQGIESGFMQVTISYN